MKKTKSLLMLVSIALSFALVLQTGASVPGLNFTAHAEEAKVIEEIFSDGTTTMGNTKAEHKGVSSGGGDHGLVPFAAFANSYEVSDEAWILYSVSAEEGKVIDSLVLDLVSRVWGQNAADGKNNKVQVYAGAVKDDLELVATYTAEYPSDKIDDKIFNVDLGKYAKGKPTVYVKIELHQSKESSATSTLATLGVKVKSVKLTYTETENAAEVKTLDENFAEGPTTMGSTVAEHKGVSSDVNWGVVPFEPWDGSGKIADEAYLLYDLKAGENKAFETLALNIKALLHHQSNTDVYEGNLNWIKVSAGAAKENLAEIKTWKCGRNGVTWNEITSGDSVDLTSVAAGLGEIYVRIDLHQSSVRSDEQGVQDLHTLGVRLGEVKFTYTEKDSEGNAAIHLSENFATGATTLESTAATVKGLSLGNDKHAGEVKPYFAVIPTESYSVTGQMKVAEESYLLYKLSAGEGKLFDKLGVDISVFVWNQDSGKAHEENNISVLAGTSTSALAECLKVTPAMGGKDGYKSFNADLTANAQGHASIYVKIAFNQSLAIGETQELNRIGVRLGAVDFAYACKEGVEEETPIVIEEDFAAETTTMSTTAAVDKNGIVSGGTHGIVPLESWAAGEIKVEKDAYITYKISAEEGEVLKNVTVNVYALIWGANTDEGHAGNNITVYAGTNQLGLEEKAVYKSSSRDSNANPSSYELDLSAEAAGHRTLYIKFALNEVAEKASLDMCGVHLKKVKISYLAEEGEEAADPALVYEFGDDYTQINTDGIRAVEKVGVAAGSNVNGLIPSETFEDPYKVAEKSYLVYELNAGENKVFETLKLNLEYRMHGQNEDATYRENAINVYVGYRPYATSEFVEDLRPVDNKGSDDHIEITLDLTKWAEGYDKVYIKIELVQSLAITCGKTLAEHLEEGTQHSVENCQMKATDDGYIGMNTAGVRLYSANFEGTLLYGASKPSYDYSTGSNFDIKGLENNGIEEYKGVGASPEGNREHGLLPGTFEDPVRLSDEAYIIYKLNAADVAEGKAFGALSVDINARLSALGRDDLYAENAIEVYVSTDGSRYELVKHFGCGDAKSDVLDTTLALDEYISGRRIVYVKIKLIQSKQTNCDHTRGDYGAAHNQGACGTYATKDGYISMAYIGVKLHTVTFNGMLTESLGSTTVTYKDGEQTLYVDNDQDIGNELNGYTPAEKEGYTFEGWYLDSALTQKAGEGYIVEGATVLYAKYNLIKYRIAYELGGGTNAPENPDFYTVLGDVALKDPTREGYTFEGWYRNSSYSGEKVTVIEASEKESVTLYAKWSKIEEQKPDTGDTGSGSGSSSEEKSGCFGGVGACGIVAFLALGAAVELKRRRR